MFKQLNILLHPSIRPITIGILCFVVLNALLTAGVTFSPLNQKFNFNYGNFLPTKLKQLKNHQPEKLNVLFMGTSQTNNGFITSEFEKAAGKSLNSFNLGLPNNRYDIMLAYLQYHQHRFGKPGLLLVELSPSIQEKDAYLYYLPALYYRTLIEQDPALALTYLSNPLLADNVKQELFYSSFSSLHQYRFTFSPINLLDKIGSTLKTVSGFQDATADANPPDEEPNHLNQSKQFQFAVEPMMTEKGWYPKEQSPHMTTPAGILLSVAEARKYYIDQQKNVYFDKLNALLAYCQQNNIPVVLVSWPNHPAFLKVFQQSRLNTAYRAGLQKLLLARPVPVIDLNRDIPTSQSETQGGLFADPRHLTPEGAQFFSRKLAKRLGQMPEASYSN